MLRLFLIFVFAFLFSAIANAQGNSTFVTGQIIHARANDTIACLDPDILREVKRQLANITPPPGWEDRIASMHCYPVAADLDWKVAEPHGDIVRAQLAEKGLQEAGLGAPVMYFAMRDMAPGSGK